MTNRTVKITVNEEQYSLEGGTSTGEVVDRFKPDANLVILNGFPLSAHASLKEGDSLYLIKKGEPLQQDELERVMMARHTPGVYEKLKKASVGIAGVGGLGSLIAIELARVGVGHLVFADFDIVEPSNLNRQHYFIEQIGMPKVEALADNLRRINPFISISPMNILLNEHNICEVFRSCTIVAEAFDRPEMKSMLVNTMLSGAEDVIVVAASGLAGFDSNNSIVTKKISSRFYLVGDGITGAMAGRGLMAPRVGIAASHQANQIIRIILGEDAV